MRAHRELAQARKTLQDSIIEQSRLTLCPGSKSVVFHRNVELIAPCPARQPPKGSSEPRGRSGAGAFWRSRPGRGACQRLMSNNWTYRGRVPGSSAESVLSGRRRNPAHKPRRITHKFSALTWSPGGRRRQPLQDEAVGGGLDQRARLDGLRRSGRPSERGEFGKRRLAADAAGELCRRHDSCSLHETAAADGLAFPASASACEAQDAQRPAAGALL